MRRIRSLAHEVSSLNDIVFLLASGFAVLFVIAYLIINPIAESGKIDNKAEFIITVEWPNKSKDDVDTWVQDPNGQLIWFQRQSPKGSLVSLERDDTGSYGDRITRQDGSVVINEHNEEIVTIRGIHPGEYIVAIHMYDKKSRGSTPVNVTLLKINPKVKQIFTTTPSIIMTTKGQEIMVVRFTVGEDGEIAHLDTSPIESLVDKKLDNQ